jgi:hypothetical protein
MYRRVLGLIRILGSQREDVQDICHWLRETAASAAPTGQGTSLPNLDIRSGWQKLVDVYEERHPDEVEAVRLARRQIDYASNDIVGRSLGCTGMEVEVRDSQDAAELASDAGGDHIPVNRLVTLSRDPNRLDWLTWSKVPPILAEMRDGYRAPGERLEYLIDRHKDFISAQNVEGTRFVTMGASALSSMLGDATQSVVSTAAPGSKGALLSAAAGVLVAGLSRGILGRRAKNLQDLLAGEAVDAWEASVSDGTASWQDEIRGRG